MEPVNATLSTSLWAVRAAPAVSPNPLTTLMTPVGNPACKYKIQLAFSK